MGNEEVNTVDAAGLYGEIGQMRTDYEQILYLTEGESEYWRQHGPEEPYRYDWNLGPRMLLAALTLGAVGTVLVWGITVLSFGILYGYQTSWNAPVSTAGNFACPAGGTDLPPLAGQRKIIAAGSKLPGQRVRIPLASITSISSRMVSTGSTRAKRT